MLLHSLTHLFNTIEVNKNGAKNIKIKGNIKLKYYPPANTLEFTDYRNKQNHFNLIIKFSTI